MSLITLINQAIATDPKAAILLNTIYEKTLSIRISSPTFFERTLLFSSQQISLVTNKQPDALIEGSLSAFLTFGITRDPHKAAQKGLFFQGDPHLLKTVQQLARTLDIDWEEIGSHYIGDFSAHSLHRFFQKIKTVTTKQAQHTTQEVLDYFTEETQHFIPRPKVDKMLQDVDNLRSQIDRLELQIDTLLDKQRVL